MRIGKRLLYSDAWYEESAMDGVTTIEVVNVYWVGWPWSRFLMRRERRVRRDTPNQHPAEHSVKGTDRDLLSRSGI